MSELERPEATSLGSRDGVRAPANPPPPVADTPAKARKRLARAQADADEKATFSGWSGIGVAFGLVMGALIGLRLATQHVRNEDHLKWIYVGVIAALLSSRYLRRSLFFVAVLYLVFCGGLFAAKHWKEIEAGRMSWKKGLKGTLEVSTGIGPGKQMAGLIRDIRARRNSSAPAPSTTNFFQVHAPQLDVAQYLQRVDTRDPQVNVRASQIVHGCDEKDRLCEATRVLGFVTDQIDYRTDPVSQPFVGDYPKPPVQTLAAGAGDCEDKTILLVSLLGTIGIKSYLVFEPGHAHALVCFDNRIETLMATRLTAAGSGAIDYLRTALGPITKSNLTQKLTAMAAPLKIGEQFCYAAETTAKGSWFGVESDVAHYGIYDPFNPAAPRVAVGKDRALVAVR